MADNMKKIILLAVALMVVAVIFPLALGLISNAGNVNVNGTAYPATLSEVADPAVVTLLTVLVPIIAIIAVVLFFLPRGKKT